MKTRLVRFIGLLVLGLILTPFVYAYIVLPLTSEVYVLERPTDDGTDGFVIILPKYILYGRSASYPTENTPVTTRRIDDKQHLENGDIVYSLTNEYSLGKGETHTTYTVMGSFIQLGDSNTLHERVPKGDALEYWQRARLHIFFVSMQCFDESCRR